MTVLKLNVMILNYHYIYLLFWILKYLISFINYKELIKHQFYWNNFLKGNFSLFNNKFELNNIITYPLNNHYTCSIKYAEIINNFYYYDDTLNNRYLSILKNIIHNNIKEQIKNNIYIIMLKKY